MNPQFYGAAIGDICGSIYEFRNWKSDTPAEINLINDKCFFTDDTAMTAAIADAARTDNDYKAALYRWANKYPEVGYASMFYEWFHSDNPQPYNSYGNGSAMRVSPIGWLFDDEVTVLEEAKRSALPTHNHPEAIKGAQATALAILLLRQGMDKPQLKTRIEKDFGYDLSRTLMEIRPEHKFDVTCHGTVPVALIAFLASSDFVSTIQNAISLGGDTDTLAAIAGSIAEAHYREIPEALKQFAREKLPKDMRNVLGIG